MKKRAICTIIVLMLIVTPSYRVYADAGTIAITGGSIAVGGAGTIATGAIAGPVVVAVFCGMMAMGMNVSLSNASQEAGMTKTQYLKSKLEEYCNEAQVTYGVFNNAILNGTTILANGAIKLGSQAGAQIKQFCNWLWNTDAVSEPSSGERPTTITQNGKTFPVLYNGDSFQLTDYWYLYNLQTDVPVSVFYWAEGNYTALYACFFSNQPTTIHYRLDGIGYTIDTVLGGPVNGYYAGGININRGTPNAAVPLFRPSNITEVLNSFDGTFAPGMSNTGTTDGFTGERETYNDRSNSLDVNPGQSTVVNPGLVGNIPIPADTDVTVNIRDYLDALQKVLDGIQDGIVAKDKDTDIPITIPIPDETVVDPTIDKEEDQDLPDQDDQTPVTDPDEPADPEQSPQTSVEPLKFDLKNIFPFCIPFDIKDMLAKLNATPVAPNYHVDWNIPLLNTSLEFDINLSCWNSVAAILRKMELLSFIVGLAVLTRNLIRG